MVKRLIRAQRHILSRRSSPEHGHFLLHTSVEEQTKSKTVLKIKKRISDEVLHVFLVPELSMVVFRCCG